jgi:hypothetical protein
MGQNLLYSAYEIQLESQYIHDKKQNDNQGFHLKFGFMMWTKWLNPDMNPFICTELNSVEELRGNHFYSAMNQMI